jgi:hypothetical protein
MSSATAGKKEQQIQGDRSIRSDLIPIRSEPIRAEPMLLQRSFLPSFQPTPAYRTAHRTTCRFRRISSSIALADWQLLSER